MSYFFGYGSPLTMSKFMNGFYSGIDKGSIFHCLEFKFQSHNAPELGKLVLFFSMIHIFSYQKNIYFVVLL